jgi:hypothetical protein
MPAGHRMRRTRAVSLVAVIVAALVVMLGCGSGLPGIVRTLAGVGADHVCTCVSGGSHASCPVCNPALRHEGRSRAPALEGVPCGEGRLAMEAAVDPAVIPESRVVKPASPTGVDGPHALSVAPDDAFIEPWTPPPRSTLSV